MSRFFFPPGGETRSTIQVLFMLYFVSAPESEPEPESESEQPYHDSAPLDQCMVRTSVCRVWQTTGAWFRVDQDRGRSETALIQADIGPGQG